MSKSTFRILILLYLGQFFILSTYQSDLFEISDTTKVAVKAFNQQNPDFVSELKFLILLLGIPLFLLHFGSLIGLFFMWNPARYLFLVSVLGMLASMLLLPRLIGQIIEPSFLRSIFGGLEDPSRYYFNSISRFYWHAFIDGAFVTLLFFGPVVRLFAIKGRITTISS